MSILKKISKLIQMSEKIDMLSQKTSGLTHENVTRLEINFERILNSIDNHQSNLKLSNFLSSHLHHVSLGDELSISSQNKRDISFQFTKELNSVLDERDEPILLATPPASPVKNNTAAKSSPPSPTKLKSPTKLPSNRVRLDSLSIDLQNTREALTEVSLQEVRTAEYLERVLNLGHKVKNLIGELEQKLQNNKVKMMASFKTLMNQNGLPYEAAHAEDLLGELFDIIHRDEGTFEQLAKNLSIDFTEKLKEQKYPYVLEPLKKKVQVLLTIPFTEDNKNLQIAFKQILEELRLPYHESIYGVFQAEYSEFLHDGDLGFHTDKFIKLFSDRLMALNILDVRNKVVEKNPTLFNSLGKVDSKPENYFELTKEAKQLGQHFIQALYNAPGCVEVLLHFQQVKEHNIKKDVIESLLSQRFKVYNQELFYVENEGKRTYIQSITEESCYDLSLIKLVSWEELSQNIASDFNNRKRHLAGSFNNKDLQSVQQFEILLSYVKESYDEVARTFALLSSIAEQNTCISFFPIKFESFPSRDSEHVCLVTTSGAVNKLDPENKKNIDALKDFQKMIKSFAEQSKPLTVDGISYTFVYHDEEKGDIDVLLQQVNKGLSGTKAPLSSCAPESELVLNDPFRGCAEKKFIDFVRCNLMQTFDSKKITILGAANLRMPIVPQREHAAFLEKSLVSLYEMYLGFFQNYVKDKGVEEFATASFKNKLKALINLPEMKAVKASKPHTDAWKERIQVCLELIEKTTSIQEISESKKQLTELLFQLSQQLDPDVEIKQNIDQLYLYKEVELIKNMIAYLSWQERVAKLKEDVSILTENDYPRIFLLSSSLGKKYEQSKYLLCQFLDKINTKEGLQKTYDHCLDNFHDLTMSPEQKNEIKFRVNTHYGYMSNFYAEILKFLQNRQCCLAVNANADILQNDINNLNIFIKNWMLEASQNISLLENVSMTTKTVDACKKEMTGAIKEIENSLRFIDDSKKKYFSTPNLIQVYTERLKEAQKIEQDQYICAFVMPVTVNYDNLSTATCETNYIDCCCACKANKLPVLTWLTELQKEKYRKLACFEHEFCFDGLDLHSMPTKKVLFSNFGFGNSTEVCSSTGLSPLVVHSLDLNDAGLDLQQQTTDLSSTNETTSNKEKVKKKLFE